MVTNLHQWIILDHVILVCCSHRDSLFCNGWFDWSERSMCATDIKVKLIATNLFYYSENKTNFYDLLIRASYDESTGQRWNYAFIAGFNIRINLPIAAHFLHLEIFSRFHFKRMNERDDIIFHLPFHEIDLKMKISLTHTIPYTYNRVNE